MADDIVAPTLNPEGIKALGILLYSRFGQYEKDRKEVELQWLRNLRQHRGIYDPEISNKIPDDQSRAYPKVTRTKVVNTVARLMEMMFPQTEKNYGIEASPLPDLATEDLQLVLDQLATENTAGGALDDSVIEKAIKSFADAKAERMAVEIDDQLSELEYITLARRIVGSAVLYSVGILEGPQTIDKKARTWKPDPITGALKAVAIEKVAPAYEFVPVWEWYPDLSAKMFAQTDGSFRRHIWSRHQVSELAKRTDFIESQVKRFLRDNLSGNYRERHWETDLRSQRSDKSNVNNLSGRKYEGWSFWGFVSGRDLRACGVAVKDTDLDTEFEANVWGLDNVVIKAQLNPYDAQIRPYHTFVFEEDDINLLGTGLPAVIRDSQLAVCEASRMLLDNASIVCGPMLETNVDLLMPGQSLDIYARKNFLREGTGVEAGMRAVNSITLDSHMTELQAIIELFMGFADSETALPPPAMGDLSQGGSEALRTQGGASMLLGAAALPIRDTVRNFDRFTTSFISSLYHWNMQFNTNEAIKGDFQVIARGSTSLIAKEVRGTHLDQFITTLSPDEKMYLKTREVLEERMKVRDLPLTLMEDKEIVDKKLQEQAAQAQATAAGQAAMIRAEVKATIAGAFKDFALAIKASASANADTFEKTVEGIANAIDAGAKPTTKS